MSQGASRLHRRVATALPLLYATLIFVQSSFPIPDLPVGLPLHLDKLIHFVEYGILSALVAHSLLVHHARFSRHAVVLGVAALSSSLYGCTDELHQAFVVGRNASWADVGADAVGSLAGAWLTVHRHARRAAGPA